MSERSETGVVRRVARRLADAAEGSAIGDAIVGWTDGPWSSEHLIDLGLGRLASAYGLSSFERDLIALVGLPEEHEVASHAARLLHPHAEPWMSTSAICRVFDLDATARRHARRTLHTGASARVGLVQSDRVGPYPEWSWRLAPGVWNALCGLDVDVPVDQSRVAGFAARSAGPAADGARFRSLLAGDRCVVVVVGGPHRTVDEVVSCVIGWMDSIDRAWTIHRPARVSDSGPNPTALPTVAHGAVAVVADAVPIVVGPVAGVPLPDHPSHLVLCVESTSGLELDDRPSTIVDLGEPDLAELASMWEIVAPEVAAEAPALAGLLRVDATTARRAAEDARLTARSTGTELDADLVVAQTRRRTDVGLPPSVRLVRPAATWESLVTTERNDALLRGIEHRVDEQAIVLGEWGFADFTNRGVRSLFSGPPGTGKTLATHVLASSLGLDLLVVDLSALVSKWLGETEKHISEVFEAADRSQAVLFFDEAEAIFGQRTDGSDAQGRWANLETAHLLNRIDAFDGLVVLATNLRGNIDDAFVRRLDVIVDFDEPDAGLRARIWRRHLPREAPVAADVDTEQLAAAYPITGGVIRNAVLSAAFAAAADGGRIDQQRLLLAVEQEYHKAGRSFPGFPRTTLEPTGRRDTDAEPMTLVTH